VSAKKDPVLSLGIERSDDVFPVEHPPVVGHGLEGLHDDVGGPLLEGLDEPIGAGGVGRGVGHARPELDLLLDETVCRRSVERDIRHYRRSRLAVASIKIREEGKKRDERNKPLFFTNLLIHHEFAASGNG
jgi:hypothetical protein